MQFLLISIHSVGKASKFNILPNGAIFSVLVYKGSIKPILALFPFSSSAYYRANWINNAAIIVWVYYIYINAFSSCFYPKRLTVHLVFTFFVSVFVPWELNP